MDPLIIPLILIVFAYLLGSVSSAIITCKLMGLQDPRTTGSRNPGATNVLRLGGKKAEAVLDDCGITVNMNMIPFDTRKPMDPSGIRIGTPALTTRGMGTDEMKRIGGWIHQALSAADDTALHEKIRGDIREFCQHFPVPADRVAAAEPV